MALSHALARPERAVRFLPHCGVCQPPDADLCAVCLRMRHAPAPPHQLSFRWALVVDDAIATGATLDVAAGTVRSMAPSAVCGLASTHPDLPANSAGVVSAHPHPWALVAQRRVSVVHDS
jgi:hypothetical protein